MVERHGHANPSRRFIHHGAQERGLIMNTPIIDIASLPGLETAQGLFGSLAQASAGYGDEVVAIMVYVYDVVPPEAAI